MCRYICGLLLFGVGITIGAIAVIVTRVEKEHRKRVIREAEDTAETAWENN